MSHPPIRVLVVDDTITYRLLVTRALESLAGVEVVGTANTGAVALNRIRALSPDLITLDHEMPDMNGIQILETLRSEKISSGVVMVSSHTLQGARITIQALELGAFDFITKTGEGDRDTQFNRLRKELETVILRFRSRNPSPRSVQPALPEAKPSVGFSKSIQVLSPDFRGPLSAVLIGVSTGGPNALANLLPALPQDYPVPLLIVQHMPPKFTGILAESLDRKCALKVVEAEEGMIPQSGHAYLAPGGKHMKLRLSGRGALQIQITEEPPENSCRPSVDVLFRSAAETLPGNCCAVILTGMGRDGTAGLKRLRERGVWAVAESAESCVVFGMPKEAIDAGLVNRVLPLSQIAPELLRMATGPSGSPSLPLSR